MKKILQLTTYPIENPDHGGKLRCYSIRNALRIQFEVKTLSFDVQKYESLDEFFVTLSYDKFIDIVGTHLFFDWGINWYLNKNLELKHAIMGAIAEYDPEIIIVEQGFLWPLIKEMLEQEIIRKNIYLIYSSHNIEYRMKHEIYSSMYSGEELNKYVTLVKDIEYDMMKNADLIWVVSDFDLAYTRNIVPEKEIYLYRNGHNGIVKTTLKQKWQELFKNSKRNWVYIASWHGPNINGLHDLINGGLLNQDSSEVMLWVFGSVGAGLLHDYNISIPENSCLKIVGPSSEEDIDSAISVCTGIVLPIWEGGGSNLKTAQALLSEKKIVASNFAFRGFETYKNEEEIFIDDKATELVNFISTLEHSEKLVVRSKAIHELKWINLLADLPQTIMHNLETRK